MIFFISFQDIRLDYYRFSTIDYCCEFILTHDVIWCRFVQGNIGSTTCTYANLSKKCSSQTCVLFSLQQHTTLFLISARLSVTLYFVFQVDGNCCWELYQIFPQRGKRHQLNQGDSWTPVFTPMSVRRMDCYQDSIIILRNKHPSPGQLFTNI